MPLVWNNALLRYYMHVPDPNALPDDEYAAMLGCLLQIRELEAKAQQKPKQN